MPINFDGTRRSGVLEDLDRLPGDLHHGGQHLLVQQIDPGDVLSPFKTISRFVQTY
jgi:hypothetical protein